MARKNIHIVADLFPRYQRLLVFNRFLKYVSIEHPNDCWEWQGQVSEKGYGYFAWPKKCIYNAHVASYVLFVGKVPKKNGRNKLCVCHSCDNPRCVNPSHLWLGTAKQNEEDKFEKGRQNYAHPVGELNHRAKLTWNEVREIRSLYATEEWSYRGLAKRFGVRSAAIWAIVTNRAWKSGGIGEQYAYNTTVN